MALYTDALYLFAGVSDLQDKVRKLTANQEVTIDGTKYTVVDKAGVDEKANKLEATTIAAKIQAGSTVNLTPADASKAVKAVDTSKPTSIDVATATQKVTAELQAANDIGAADGKSTVTAGTATADGTIEFAIQKGHASVANTLSFNLHVGADADSTNKITVNIDSMSTAGLGIKGLNVKDSTGTAATYAIDAIADAISTVSSQRSSLGAVQNRLEHTINNLDNVSENTTSAESRIRDTDMAKEMVNYSKNNILAQAGQSMLAQANQSNQGVLSLLQ